MGWARLCASMTLAVFLARGALPASLARTLPRLALHGLLLACACAAWGLDWQVLPAPDAQPPGAAQAQFLSALRAPATDADTGADAQDTPVNAGVRTRGLRAPPPGHVALAVGPEAARAALAQAPPPGANAPLLLALLSRQEFEALPPAQRPRDRVAVLLRETSPADQLNLADALLPGRRRLGLVVTTGSQALLRELRHAAEADARGWSLQIETADDPLALGAALRAVLPRSDLLIVLPDAIGASQAATLAVLRAAAAAGVPVIGPNEGSVRSGALAASIATPARLARQAHGLGERLLARTSGDNGGDLLVEWAAPAQVRVNPHVARSLDLRLPSEQELTQRLAAPRGRS